MEKRTSQNLGAAVFTAVCLIVGFAIGYSLFKESTPVISSRSPFSDVRDVRDIIKIATDICGVQMIQFAVVLAAGFTFFSYPVCGALLLYRGAACGYSAAVTVASGGLSSAALPQTVSYIIVTAVFAVLAYGSLDTVKSIRSEFDLENRASLFSRAASLVYLFLLTSGSAVFMKVLPLMIFTK